MANVIEILLVVRDLATKRLDQASRSIERDMTTIKRSSGDAGTSLSRFSKDTDEAGRTAQRSSRDLATVARELEGAERALSSLGGATEGLPGDVERHVAALRQERAELQNVARESDSLVGSIGRFTRALASNVAQRAGFSRSNRDNVNELSLMERGSANLAVGLGRLAGAFGFLGRLGGGVRRAFADFQFGATTSAKDAEMLTGRMERMGFAFANAGRSLPLFSFGLARMLGLVVVLATAVPLLSGGVLALAGAAGALAASLGSLLSVAIALPAALGALGGVMAAVLTIIKPAISPIATFVQQTGAAQEKGTTAATGTKAAATGGPTPQQQIRQAEQNLTATRRIGALQVKRLEQELAQARLDGVFRVRDAERQLADTRRQAFQRLVDLERQLADLRASNDAQRSQLEQSLADAQARQRADAARGGQHSILTQALVGEAKSDLDRFNTQAKASEQDLVTQIVRQRQDGIRQIRAAEQNLQQVRIDNIAHIADLENSLKQTRIQNAQQEAAAEKALEQAQKQAREGPAGAAPAVDALAARYKALSPIQQRIADQVLALKKRWQDLTEAFRNRFLVEVEKDLRALSDHLPLLAQQVGGFADIITNTLGRVRGLLNDPSFLASYKRDVADATTNTDLFSRAGVKVLDALVRLVDVSRPLLDFISRTALAWAIYADNATKAGQANGSLVDFFKRVRDRLKLVLDILGNLAGAFFNIGKIAAPFGDVLLRQLDRFTQRFQDFTNSRKGKSEIRAFFKDAIPAAESIIGFVDTLVGKLADLGRDFIRGGKKSPLAQIFDTLSAGIGPLGDAIGNIAKASGPDLARLITDLAKLLETFSKHTGGITLALKFLDGVARFVNFLVQHGGPVGSILGDIVTPLALFVALSPKAALGLAKFLLIADASGKRGLTRLAGGLADAGGAVIDFGKKCLVGLANLGKLVFEMAVSAVRAVATFVVAMVTGALDAVATFATFIVSTAIPAVVEFTLALLANPFVLIGLAIVALIVGLVLLVKHWGQVKAFLLRVWHELRHAAGEVFGKIKDVIVGAFDAIKSGVTRLFGAAIDFVEGHWKDLLAFFLGPVGWLYLVLKFTGLWDKIKDGVRLAWDWIKQHITDAWHGIVNFFSNTAPGLLRRAFEGLFDGAKHVIRAALNDILGGIEWFLNKFRDGLKKIWDFIPDLPDFPIPKIDLPEVPVFDTGGVVPAGPGQKTGDARLVVAHVGETFVPTHRGLGGAPGGGGSVGSNALGGVVDFIGSHLPDPRNLLPKLPHLTGAVGDLIHGMLSMVKDKVIHWAEGKFDAIRSAVFSTDAPSVTPQVMRGLRISGSVDQQNRFAGIDWGEEPYSAALTPYAGGSPPWNRRLSNDQALKVANLALSISGALSRSNIAAFLGRASQESGWQSGIINQWDTNWAHGIPSVGLLQMIGPTFGSHLLRPFTNIWDPLHNAISAVRYMLANYHHIVGPSGTGYWTGGILGAAQPGKTPGLREGQPLNIIAHVGEWILNQHQIGRVARALGGLERAREVVFGTQVPINPTRTFAAGGPVTAPAAQVVERHMQVGPIYTTSPKIDADYVSRIMEQRLLQGA